MKTVRRQGGIIQIRDKRITQLTERQTIVFNMWKVVKKKCLNESQKVKKRSYLLKSQESAQQCWEFKIVLQIRKSAEKVPRAIGTCLLLGTKYVRERIPKY